MQTCRTLAYLRDYLLRANIAAFIPQRGQVLMPMPSIRIAGFTSRQMFCELKIILWNFITKECFSSQLLEEFT